MKPRARVVTGTILIIVLAAILVISFWPTPVDRPIDSGLFQLLRALHHAGAPHWVNYAFVEISANVLMYAPLGALVVIFVPLPYWWVSAVLGLALSLCVEFAQAVFLPHRVGSASDLAANTAGTIIGGVIVAVIRFRRGSTG